MASKPSPATVQALQAKETVLQKEIAKFRELQKGMSAMHVLAISHMCCAMTRTRTNMHTETQKCTASRQQLDGQLNENKTVKEVRVIKLVIGPAELK